MPDWIFSAMTEADIEQVVVIEEGSFNTPWSRISYLSELGCKDSSNFVLKYGYCKNNQLVIAYICFRLIANEIQLLKIATAPEWRRQGAATWLFNKCMNVARETGASKIFLEVRPSNNIAIIFYHKFGFKIIGKRPNYYTDSGEDALVMIINLKENLK